MGYEMILRILTSAVFVVTNLLCADLSREDSYESVIIGGGVGGGAAAIYLARAGFHPLVIEKDTPGSAIAQSTAVENWPGAMKIRGTELMERIHKQAETNGAVFIDAEVVSVDFSHRPFKISMRASDRPDVLQTVYAQTCIIATGAESSRLGVPGEKKYWGRGVSCCAICDGSLYRQKKVGVVGGGDSAVLEALYLANIADEVTVFVRGNRFKAIDVKKRDALLSLPNVKVSYQTRVMEIIGNEERMNAVRLSETDQPSREKKIDGLFLAIGSKPNTALFRNQVQLDDLGYIVLKKGQETFVEGVYAIGDVVDPYYKQAISAAGDGAKAALSIIQSDFSWEKPASVSKAEETTPAAMIEVVEITSQKQFEEELKSSTTPMIVDFYATWCSPCKRIAPKIKSTAASLSGKIKFLKVNIDEVKGLTQNYKIMSMPTILYFNESGEVIDRKVGEREINDLLHQLNAPE